MLLLSPTQLPSGPRVRLRLPHVADGPGLRALHESVGLELDDVALSRILRADPRQRAVVVATAWIGGHETVVGFASGELGAEPELVIADDLGGAELTGLLADALAERAAAVGRVA